MSVAVDRLTIEAGKYNDLTAGATIDRQEVVKQAKANGYSDREANALLEDEGTTIEIPDQGDLFGEKWATDQADDLITQPDNTVESFRQWLEQKRESNVTEYDSDDGTCSYQFDPEHNWSHYQARKNFGRAKDVDRYFQDSYDDFTTVLITRTADDNTDPLLKQTKSMTPKAYYQSRYRLLRRLADDYALVEVRAPKYPTQSEKTVRTHIHTGVWLPGHHSVDDFELLRGKHMDTILGATDIDISVEHHSTDTYPPVENGLDDERGATTALPYELAGKNQPLMNVERDAKDLYDDRSLEWCATLSAGDDDTHSTAGKSYWKELGNFDEYAHKIGNSLKRKTERDYYNSLGYPYRSQRSELNVMSEICEPDSLLSTEVTPY